MNIKMDLSDLLGLYAKTALSISGRISSQLVAGFHNIFQVDDDLKYEYFRNKGVAHAKQRRYRQAENILSQLRAIRQDDAEIALYLGISQLKLGQQEMGLLHLKEAYDGLPDNNQIGTILGIAYFQAEDYKNALPLLKEAAKTSPDDFKVHYQLGVAYDKTKKPLQAIEEFNKALIIEPGNTKVLRMLGYLYEAQDQKPEAAEVFKRAMELEEETSI